MKKIKKICRNEIKNKSLNTEKKTDLEKYLDKKKKQIRRDELLNELSKLQPDSKICGKELKNKTAEKPKIVCKNSSEQILSEPAKNFKENEFTKSCVLNEQKDIEYLQEKIITSEHKDEVNLNDYIKSSYDLKNKIINLKEIFISKKACYRLPEIQEKRKRLEIYYQEHGIIETIKFSLFSCIQGVTGCGKSTQIPQFLYENGFAETGLIGVTQPRRVATIAISERINYEFNEVIAAYQIKYESTITEKTKIKIMTEGILLREIQSDFLLLKYSVIIMDEIHERTANSDIICSLLPKIVGLRFDKQIPLRVIFMSATLSISCLKSFIDVLPFYEIESNVHKVNIIYNSVSSHDYVEEAYSKVIHVIKFQQNIDQNVTRLPQTVENSVNAAILVFLPSKQDIYALKSRLDLLKDPLVILPLHSGLSKSDQSKIFEKYPDQRKIILATNIAETSITVDDVVFVIDSGKVKSRFCYGNINMYKTINISKSSAKQRAGRAGRTKPGVCYRLYTGETFQTFMDEDVPELITEPLEGHFLQLKDLGIRNLFKFRFLTAISETRIYETIKNLAELGAIDSDGNLSLLGSAMARFPVQPKYSRLLLLDVDDVHFLIFVL